MTWGLLERRSLASVMLHCRFFAVGRKRRFAWLSAGPLRARLRLWLAGMALLNYQDFLDIFDSDICTR